MGSWEVVVSSWVIVGSWEVVSSWVVFVRRWVG